MVFDDLHHRTLKMKGTPSHLVIEPAESFVAYEPETSTVVLQRRLKAETTTSATTPLPELLVMIKAATDRNKEAITILSAQMWGCLVFVTMIIGAVLLCLQLVGCRSRRLLSKRTFDEHQKEMALKLEELNRLKIKVKFLQTMTQLDQMTVRENPSSGQKFKFASRATLPAFNFSSMHCGNQLSSFSTNQVNTQAIGASLKTCLSPKKGFEKRSPEGVSLDQPEVVHSDEYSPPISSVLALSPLKSKLSTVKDLDVG